MQLLEVPFILFLLCAKFLRLCIALLLAKQEDLIVLHVVGFYDTNGQEQDRGMPGCGLVKDPAQDWSVISRREWSVMRLKSV